MAGRRRFALVIAGAAIAAGALTFSQPTRWETRMQIREPEAESIAKDNKVEHQSRYLRLRAAVESMTRSMRQRDRASGFVAGIGNPENDGAASIAGYEGMLSASAHNVELVPADPEETEAAVSEAFARKDSESLGRLATIVASTFSIEPQSQACSAIESIALMGSNEAGIELARIAPFVIDEGAREAAFDSLETVLADADAPTRKAMLKALSFHLKSGPLTHWSLSGDRSRVLEMLERFE